MSNFLREAKSFWGRFLEGVDFGREGWGVFVELGDFFLRIVEGSNTDQ